MSCKQRKLRSKPWITKGYIVSYVKKSYEKSHYILGDETKKHEYKVYANGEQTGVATLEHKFCSS